MCYPLDDGKVHIVVDSFAGTRAMMLAILAHEMIHQYQHQHGQAMTHGESFQEWADWLHDLTGLTA